MLSALDKRILLTISYTDQFLYPLTEREVWLRLVGMKSTFAQVQRQISALIGKKLLRKSHDFIQLSSSSDLFQTRVARYQVSQTKRAEAEQFVRLATLIPWIRGIALTGSVAVNNAKPDDDIDFLIVTSRDRLWLSRLVVTLIAWGKGKRRSWKHEEKNSWCFNLWLDEDSLTMPPARRSVYTAYEIAQADWVWQRDSIDQCFLRENPWVKQWLPNYFYTKAVLKRPVFSEILKVLDFLLSPFFSILEKIAYAAQLRYMQAHRTRETVSPKVAFFHPRDTRSQVMNNWRKAICKEPVYY